MADIGAHTIQMEGDSFDKGGESIAHWRSTAVGIRPSDRSVSYMWEGEHPTAAPGTEFKGFGQLTFRPAIDLYIRGDGVFTDVRVGEKLAAWKSVEVRRVDSEDLDRTDQIMREGSDMEKAEIVKETLDRFKHGHTGSQVRG